MNSWCFIVKCIEFVGKWQTRRQISIHRATKVALSHCKNCKSLALWHFSVLEQLDCIYCCCFVSGTEGHDVDISPSWTVHIAAALFQALKDMMLTFLRVGLYILLLLCFRHWRTWCWHFSELDCTYCCCFVSGTEGHDVYHPPTQFFAQHTRVRQAMRNHIYFLHSSASTFWLLMADCLIANSN